jgi:hypothetical protein
MMKVIDPAFLLLRWLVLARFLRSELDEQDQQFVMDNIDKHRMSMWINVVTTICVIWGLRQAAGDQIGTVITAMLGPVMVMGGAWFAITFGGIPKRLIDVAMSVTFWLFTAFIVSLSSMFVAVAFVTSPAIWVMLAVVYIGAYFSCVQYDTADGLKAGLDEAQLGHSRAALRFYKEKHEIEPE